MQKESRVRCIGLTGGIGTGKSTVSRVLRTLGYVVYDADRAAKRLYDEDAVLLKAVADRFGEDILSEDGRLDRARLAAQVFADPAALDALNALVHPAVRADFQAWKAQCERQGADLVFREAAILFESGQDVDCDAVWAVSAPEALRLQRLKNRSGMTVEEVRHRMARQWAPERIENQADRLLFNDGQRALVPQILQAMDSLH